MKREKKENKKRIICISLFIISALFYLVWYWHDGIILTPDADSYINMTSDREPGYCSFLWILRLMFGSERYLHAAVILQCLIAAAAAVAITTALWERFELSWMSALCILVIQYGITLLNRFVAQRRYSYYNSIETEGLTYSLWIFFFLSVIGILYEKDKKNIVLSIIWAVILTSIRKQMLITFGIIFLCLLYIWWREKKWKKALVYALMIILVGLIGTKIIDCVYNYAARGVFASHTGDSSFVLGTEIYLADITMAEKIEGEELQGIFREIMERTREEEYNVSFAGSGWSELENHYSNSYDRIKFDVINVVIREYQDRVGIPKDMREENYHEIVGSLMQALLLPCLPDMIKLFCANVIHGMITTVLKVHPILNWIALILYVMYISLFALLVNRKSYKAEQTSVLPFAALVLLAIISNVMLTSITIYCQMRYMLYNTGLFYQAGLIMVIEVLRIFKMQMQQRGNR